MSQTKTFYQSGPQDYLQLDWDAYTVRATPHATRAWPPPIAEVKSILVIKLDALGDYLLYTPFFEGLRALYPHARITLLCGGSPIPLAEKNRVIDHILLPEYEIDYNEPAAFLFAMRLQQHVAAPFDLTIMARWSEDWQHGGVIAQTVDSPWRVSYAANTADFKRHNFLMHDDFYTHVIEDSRPAHEVWRGLQILHALGAPMPPVEAIKLRFYYSKDDAERVDQLLAGRDLPRPWILLGVGGSAAFKRWPGMHFGELAQSIAQQLGGSLLIIGHGQQDEAVANDILAIGHPNIFNLVGQLSLREAGVITERCDVIVCNDSFALHTAAAVGTPAVEVVGHPQDGNPESEYLPSRFGPWGIPFAWIQPVSCGGSENLAYDYLNRKKCIADIPANAVFEALTEILRRWPKLH